MSERIVSTFQYCPICLLQLECAEAIGSHLEGNGNLEELSLKNLEERLSTITLTKVDSAISFYGPSQLSSIFENSALNK